MFSAAVTDSKMAWLFPPFEAVNDLSAVQYQESGALRCSRPAPKQGQLYKRRNLRAISLLGILLIDNLSLTASLVPFWGKRTTGAPFKP